MLIDVSYFKGALQIPNIDKDQTAFEDNYITPYESEILTRLLGNDLYQQVLTNYDTGVDDKWKDLVEGTDYEVEVNGVTYDVKWNGLINSDKLSLIAYYVYFNYVKQNYQQLTGLGVSANVQENATIVSPNEKLVWSWNECKRLSGTNVYDNYSCLQITDQVTVYNELQPSLFNFINENITDYDNWIYNSLKGMNVLGI
jgi:hypothetical protein